MYRDYELTQESIQKIVKNAFKFIATNTINFEIRPDSYDKICGILELVVFSGYFKKEDYAKVIAEKIYQNHCLINGNKRMARYMFLYFSGAKLPIKKMREEMKKLECQ